MRKKDLIDVILKVGGLFVLLQTISANLTTTVLMLLNDFNWETISYVSISILIFLLVLYFFVLRTNVIISLMKIDNESLLFEKTNINKSSILSIGIILIGVFLIVNSIANIIIEATDLLLSTMINGNGYFNWYVFVYLIVGSILVAKNKKIVQIINQKES